MNDDTKNPDRDPDENLRDAGLNDDATAATADSADAIADVIKALGLTLPKLTAVLSRVMAGERIKVDEALPAILEMVTALTAKAQTAYTAASSPAQDTWSGAMPYSPPWEPPESVPLTPEELARRRAEEDIDDAMDAVGNSGGRVDGLGVFGGGIFSSGARLSSYERTRERIVELIDKRAAEAAVAATMKAREDVLREEADRLRAHPVAESFSQRCSIYVHGNTWTCRAAGCGATGPVFGSTLMDSSGTAVCKDDISVPSHPAQPCLFDMQRARAAASWASAYIAKLRAGETVSFRPRGNSMAPRIESGQLCVVAPVDARTVVAGDIVLCRVRGFDYLHFVKAVDRGRYQIGNAHGGINGWIGPAGIYGRLVRIDP